jgi:hypothetical protein
LFIALKELSRLQELEMKLKEETEKKKNQPKKKKLF